MDAEQKAAIEALKAEYPKINAVGRRIYLSENVHDAIDRAVSGVPTS